MWWRIHSHKNENTYHLGAEDQDAASLTRELGSNWDHTLWLVKEAYYNDFLGKREGIPAKLTFNNC